MTKRRAVKSISDGGGDSSDEETGLCKFWIGCKCCLSFGKKWPNNKAFDDTDKFMEFALDRWPTTREVTVDIRSTGDGLVVSHGIYNFSNQKAGTTKAYWTFLQQIFYLWHSTPSSIVSHRRRDSSDSSRRSYS